MSDIRKGDLVRFKSGKCVVIAYWKYVEYDLKNRIGTVVSVPRNRGVYIVDVVLDNEHYNVGINSSDIEIIGSESVKDLMSELSRKSFAESFERYLKSVSSVFGDLVREHKSVVKPAEKIVFTGNESKMPKSKCIELLQRYRAEREKLRSGRRFELCLRSNVVDAALERAIELLKGGSE